jgi:hypothetical protein
VTCMSAGCAQMMQYTLCLKSLVNGAKHALCRHTISYTATYDAVSHAHVPQHGPNSSLQRTHRHHHSIREHVQRELARQLLRTCRQVGSRHNTRYTWLTRRK